MDTREYLSFTEYCEEMEITIITYEDYWDYVSYCEMNSIQYDIMEGKTW